MALADRDGGGKIWSRKKEKKLNLKTPGNGSGWQWHNTNSKQTQKNGGPGGSLNTGYEAALLSSP